MKNIPKFQKPFKPLGLSQDNTTITQPINHSNMIRHTQEHEKYLREKHPNSNLSYGELAQLDRDINSKQQPVITNPPTRFETEQMKQNRLAYQQKVKENQENEITPEQYGQALGALEFMGYATLPFDLYGLRTPLIQGSKFVGNRLLTKTVQGINKLSYNMYHKPIQKYQLGKFKKELLSRNLLNEQQQKLLSKVKIKEGPFAHSPNTIYLPREYRIKSDNGFSLGHEIGHQISTPKTLDDFKTSQIYSNNYSYHPEKDFELVTVGEREFPRKITEQYSDYIGTLGGETPAETVLQNPAGFYFTNRIIANPQLFPQSIKQYGNLNLSRNGVNPDFDLFGKYLAEGSENMVFNHPKNPNVVYKVNTDYTGDINDFINSYINARNEVPLQLPLRAVGQTKEGFPIMIQPKVTRTLTESEFKEASKELQRTLEKNGYRGYIEGYMHNKRLSAGDFSPGNMGYDKDGYIRFIDIDASYKKQGGKLIPKHQTGNVIQDKYYKFIGPMYHALYKAFKNIGNVSEDQAMKLARYATYQMANESGYGTSRLAKQHNYGGMKNGNKGWQKFSSMEDFANQFVKNQLKNFKETLTANNYDEYINGLFDYQYQYASDEGKDLYNKRLQGVIKRVDSNIDKYIKEKSRFYNYSSEVSSDNKIFKIISTIDDKPL